MRDGRLVDVPQRAPTSLDLSVLPLSMPRHIRIEAQRTFKRSLLYSRERRAAVHECWLIVSLWRRARVDVVLLRQVYHLPIRRSNCHPNRRDRSDRQPVSKDNNTALTGLCVSQARTAKESCRTCRTAISSNRKGAGSTFHFLPVRLPVRIVAHPAASASGLVGALCFGRSVSASASTGNVQAAQGICLHGQRRQRNSRRRIDGGQRPNIIIDPTIILVTLKHIEQHRQCAIIDGKGLD